MSLHRGEDLVVSQLEGASVTDGEWHHLQLEVGATPASASADLTATLTLDHALYRVSRNTQLCNVCVGVI